jgi:hypothetical protein
VANVYIDSNVIVSAEIPAERNHKESKRFMDFVLSVRLPDVNYVTSVFTFLELASAMIRRTKSQHRTYSLLYRIQKTWKDSIRPYPPLEPARSTSYTRLVDSLAETAIRFRTPTGDSIHAQTVALYRFDFLVTWNVRHFAEMPKRIKKLKILTPPEMLAEIGPRASPPRPSPISC